MSGALIRTQKETRRCVKVSGSGPRPSRSRGSRGLTGCAGFGGQGGKHTVNVLMVNNPQMVDLQKLTAANFTKQTGIKVNFTTLPENDIRDKASQEFSSQAGQYDVATLSNFEIPFYSKNGWLAPMDDYVKADPGFNQADILKPMTESLTGPDGKLYGEPFYGESSFLMYRKDVFAAKGLTAPSNPTWQQIADPRRRSTMRSRACAAAACAACPDEARCWHR